MGFLNKAVEIAPTIPGPRLNRANLAFRIGDLSSAEADITAVVTSQLNSFEAWFNAASMCASMAQSTLQAELSQGVNPDEAQKHANALYDRAEVFYRTALGVRPDSAIAHANLGKLMLLLGKNDAAVFSFKQACDLNPKNLEYQGYLQQAEIRASSKPAN
jgi:tetratricopeptide (TPR) repeat protein